MNKTQGAYLRVIVRRLSAYTEAALSYLDLDEEVPEAVLSLLRRAATDVAADLDAIRAES